MKLSDFKIGLFDSGYGGLSVLRAIAQKLPFLNYVYCADHLHFPYGTKSKKEIVDCLIATIDWVLSRHPLEMIVIACNTASTSALEELRKRYMIPIVGVVPAIKTAARLSVTKEMGLLATQSTVGCPYTNHLIQSFADDCKVLRVASSKLVHIAEHKLEGREISLEEIWAEILPFFSKLYRIDTVVLGCTHFPLLHQEFNTLTSKQKGISIQWIDSGEAIAKRVESILPKEILDQNQRLAEENQKRLVDNAHASQVTLLSTQPGKSIRLLPDFLFSTNPKFGHSPIQTA